MCVQPWFDHGQSKLKPHLVVSISGHGFGHVAQTAPVLNRLHRLLPQLRLTVRSAVLSSHLRSRIHAPFDQLGSEGDIGMLMSSAIDVLADESGAAYRAFHANCGARRDRNPQRRTVQTRQQNGCWTGWGDSAHSGAWAVYKIQPG